MQGNSPWCFNGVSPVVSIETPPPVVIETLPPIVIETLPPVEVETLPPVVAEPESAEQSEQLLHRYHDVGQKVRPRLCGRGKQYNIVIVNSNVNNRYK